MREREREREVREGQNCNNILLFSAINNFNNQVTGLYDRSLCWRIATNNIIHHYCFIALQRY